VLLENDDVADAAVCALNKDHEDLPRAYVVLKETAKGKVSEKDVIEWIATKVAKHKRLTGGVKFIDEVPKSPSGKIQRVVLREWAKRDAEQVTGIKARL
jgi:4-coumarate--CoA ligase